jgi:fatty acid/phospholipid biosynthesis enzyme
VTRIALDGRGAERGTEAIVAGARAVAADGIQVRVFGDPGELAALNRAERIEVVAATGAIGNDDDPVAAIRGNPGA